MHFEFLFVGAEPPWQERAVGKAKPNAIVALQVGGHLRSPALAQITGRRHDDVANVFTDADGHPVARHKFRAIKARVESSSNDIRELRTDADFHGYIGILLEKGTQHRRQYEFC